MAWTTASNLCTQILALQRSKFSSISDNRNGAKNKQHKEASNTGQEEKSP